MIDFSKSAGYGGTLGYLNRRIGVYTDLSKNPSKNFAPLLLDWCPSGPISKPILAFLDSLFHTFRQLSQANCHPKRTVFSYKYEELEVVLQML